MSPGGRFGKYALAPGHELAPVQAAIQAHVDSHHGQGRHVLTLPQDPRPGSQLALDPVLVRRLRNAYLHRSAGIGFWADGRKGMGERTIGNQIRREVYAG